MRSYRCLAFAAALGLLAPLAQAADPDPLDPIRRVAGVDHLGIGSDCDGMSSAPVGLEDVSRDPALLAELLRRGHSEDDVAEIAGLDVLRVLRAVEATASRLQAARPPSEVLLPAADSTDGRSTSQ